MQSVSQLARSHAARSKRRRTAVPLLALLIAAFAAPHAKAVPSESPQGTWVTDKSVKATAKIGDTLYIGGEFEQVAPRTGPAAAFDATSAELTGTPLISGSVGVEAEVVESDGSGGYYVGGNFSHARGEARQGIVHVKADGSLDPNFALQLRERVNAIALDGNTLYVGGRVFEVDGEARGYVAAFDAETGELLSWAPELNGQVNAMVVQGDHVYLGGAFTQVDGQNRARIASVGKVGSGAGEGEVTAWNPIANGEVFAMTISGSTLYVGGKFTQVESTERRYLAGFDLSAGEPGEPEMNAFATTPNNYVVGIAVSEDGETVYAGGEFIQVNGESHPHLVALQAGDGALINEWVAGTSGKVHDLAVSGSTLYAAGEFNQAGGQTQWAAAAFDAEGTGTLQEWDPKILGAAHSIALVGSDVVIGGFFNGANAIARNHIAAIDLTTGEPTAWAPEANKNVYALAMSEDGTRVFVGGYYTEIGGEARERLASLRAYGTGAGEGEPTAWNPGAANSVEAIEVDGSRVYVGGGFPTMAGKSAFANLAAFDFSGDVGTLDESWKPAPNNNVYALEVGGEFVYVGGQFSSIGGQPRKNIAAVDKAAGTASETWAPEPNSRVRAIAVSGTSVFAGGLFETVGGVSHKHLVEIDASGEPTSWAGETDNEVYGVAVDGSAVYAGGSFNRANGVIWKRLAAFDITDGELLPWNPAPRDQVNSLEYADSQLIVGGAFHSTEMGAQKNIAVFSAPVLNVLKSGAGEGSVSSAPAGIECGSTCSAAFGAGEEVTLTATADAGSEFSGWSGGGCTGTGTCVVTLDADVTVTAQFASAPEGGGSGEGEGEGGEGEGGGAGSGSGDANGSGTGSSAGDPSGGDPAAATPIWIDTKVKKAMIGKLDRRSAGFWFATKGPDRAERFQCALVKWPQGKNVKRRLKQKKIRFKPCGPRKRIYRQLKPGRYTFRVRAIGENSWDRKAAKRQFRIG